MIPDRPDRARRRSISAGIALSGIASMLLASCGDGSGGTPPAPAPAPTPTPTPSPAPSPAPSGLFVNPAPDTASDKASAFVGWTATAGATGYIVRYSIDGGAVAQVTLGPVTGTQLVNLPAGSQVSVTIAAISATGTSADSPPVAATLPRPATAGETASYANAAAYSDSKQGEAVVVMRYGRVVYSHYTSGYANTAHALASGSKSFSCALEGFAEQDGLLALTDRASSVITDWQSDPDKSKITVLDLLSLQSGLTGNPAYLPLTASTLDTYQLAVTETDSYAPGQAFVYDPLSFQNFAMIFQLRSGGGYGGNGQVTGGTDPVDYLQTKLFTPLGIPASAYGWGRDAKNHPQMAGGASFAATDWLKYGQFALQRGTWQSNRLLPAATIDYCTGGYKNPAFLGYGVTWWLNAHTAGTYDPAIDRVPGDAVPVGTADQFAPDAPADMYMAAGAGFERLYVVPSLGLVVVRFAPIGSAVTVSWSDNTFLGKLIGTLP
ncbi:MAG: serine hydrolase [Pseudomonadota bacterium]